MTQELHFDARSVHRPSLEALTGHAEDACAALGSAGNEGALAAALRGWDRVLRGWDTERYLAEIRFAQEPSAPERRADREALDALEPEVLLLEQRVLRAVFASPASASLDAVVGPHARSLWRLALESFDLALVEDRRAELELASRYPALHAGARFEARGQPCSLSALRGLLADPDRAVRRDAAAQEDRFYLQHAGPLDALFEELVAQRTRMASKLGHESYTPLAYATLRRSDWGPAEAAAVRSAVQRHLLPLAREVWAARARRLGVGKLCWHDEQAPDAGAGARPRGDGRWLLSRAGESLGAVDPELGPLVQRMLARGAVDLDARPGKAPGGFAAPLEELGVPFLFANCVGTEGDVRVVLHELGHCAQWAHSAALPHRDLVIPTMEAAEICSIGLELLGLPFAEHFVDDAEGYRRSQLEFAATFTPYACAVDAFQHDVYAEPSLGPAGRNARWSALEREWLPWRDYDGLAAFEAGRLWQRQRHLYSMPFYYLDYCLAQLCALQLWRASLEDPAAAYATWRRLCALGGSLSFRALVREAGLEDPFEERVVASLAESLRRALGV